MVKDDDSIGPYEVRDIPRAAQFIDDFTTVAKGKNLIWTFSEFDITDVRKILKEHKEKTGEGISFTAFLITWNPNLNIRNTR